MDIENLLMQDLNNLQEIANLIRKGSVGDTVHIRALMEISNVCFRNCAYCGLRLQNANLKRYTMPLAEIEKIAKQSFDCGYKTVVLQSGENKEYDIEKLANMVERLTDYGLTVTLSLGELSFDELKTLKNAGAKRYLLKFETADEVLYKHLHRGHTLSQRLNCLSQIKNLGYEVGSGFLVGLPNESVKSLALNLQVLKDFECDMVGIGAFIPHKDTPLSYCNSGSYETTAKCVAITRIILPKSNIPITTSLGEIGDKYSLFDGGANVIMINVTPRMYAKDYQIYPKQMQDVDILKDRINIEKIILERKRMPL